MSTEYTPPTSVLIVDDEIDMRMLVRLIVELGDDGIEVVGEAADGLEALDKYFALNPPTMPSVIVLDNRMPGLNGLEAAKAILDAYPDQLVILYSAHLSREIEIKAADLGIARCLHKEQLEEIPEVIKELLIARDTP